MKSYLYFRNAALIVFVSMLSFGCGDDDILEDLYGTWESSQVAVSGFGLFDGTSMIRFNEDLTYRSDIDFETDATTACRAVLYWEGTYTATETRVTLTPTGGEVEVLGCNDATLNAAKRTYTDAEVAAAATSMDWKVTDGTLELIHSDGLDRTYQKK